MKNQLNTVEDYRTRAIIVQKKMLGDKDGEILQLKNKIDEQRKMLKTLNELYLGKAGRITKIKFLIKEIFKIKKDD